MPLNEVEAIAHECANLLIVYYTYVETIKRFDPKGTRFDLLRRQIHIKVTENDLILRLCRLDDDDTTQHSLREALRSIRNSLPQAKVTAIDRRLKKYRQLINPMKTKARNYYLAHLSKSAEVPHDRFVNFQKEVDEVINIFDMISGEAVRYVLRAGSQELELDLRQELLKGSQPRPRSFKSGRERR